MVNRAIFWIACCVFVCNTFIRAQNDVQSTGTLCKTHADCKGNWLYKYCCGGDTHKIDRTTRVCGFHSCLDKYCATNSHCGDPSLCCHSNVCVDRSCSGCALNSDCSPGHVCCKKSFGFNQAFCAKDCVGQQCNNNDDCVVRVECCRDGKCTNSHECFEQCKSNSECGSGEYCCKKKSVWFWQDRCTETCVGEDCLFDHDCGPPNECCFSKKCTNQGCSKCASDSDCTEGLCCCKERYPNEAGICQAHCNGKPCENTSVNRGETNAIGTTTYSSDKSARRKINRHHKDSSLPWRIVVIVVAGLLIAIGVPIAMFWCYKQKRARNTTQNERESLQSIQNQGPENALAEQYTQFAGFNYENPIQQQRSEFSLQPSSNQLQQNKQSPISPNTGPRNNDGHVNLLYNYTDEAEHTDVAPTVGQNI